MPVLDKKVNSQLPKAAFTSRVMAVSTVRSPLCLLQDLVSGWNMRNRKMSDLDRFLPVRTLPLQRPLSGAKQTRSNDFSKAHY
jgi:hypothetical protein